MNQNEKHRYSVVQQAVAAGCLNLVERQKRSPCQRRPGMKCAEKMKRRADTGVDEENAVSTSKSHIAKDVIAPFFGDMSTITISESTGEMRSVEHSQLMVPQAR